MSIRILIADDYELFRRGLRAILEDHPDFQVVGEAEHGQRCVELAQQLEPDLITMDVTMPLLNGIEATRQIRAFDKRVKIIAISMHPERRFVAEILAVGASGYLFKDTRFEELVSAIETVMRGGTYLSSNVEGIFRDHSDSSAVAHSYCSTLSPRERQVLQMVADGKNTKEIAYLLHLSTKTIEGHRRQIMEKLSLYSVADLTRYAIREGVTCLQ